MLDTSVLIAALRSRKGASFRLLYLVGDPRWQTNISVALALEYESVGKREAAQIGIPVKVIDDIVDFLCAAGRRHAVPFRVRPVLPDPNDDFVLELAIAGRCDWIVTHNVKDFGPASVCGVRAVTPAEFLRTIAEE